MNRNFTLFKDIITMYTEDNIDLGVQTAKNEYLTEGV